MTGTGFWWILLACAVYGIVHSLLASLTVKAHAAGWVGDRAYQRGYRLFFVIVGSITAVPLFILTALLPDRAIYAIPAPWMYLTLAIQAAAMAALLLAVLQTGAMRFVGISQLFSLEEASKPGKLVTGGFYRYVRHPLYTASFLLLWLTPVMTWNILALCIGLSAYMLIGTIYEERKLVKEFGKEYEEYRKRTGRIVPGWKGR